MLLYMFVMIPNGSTSETIHAGGYGSEYVFLKWMMKSLLICKAPDLLSSLFYET